jgi:hypothetical protein
MTVRIELPRESEDALKARAQAAGLTVDEFARQVLERELAVPRAPLSAPPQGVRAVAEEIRERFRNLTGPAFDEPRLDGASQHDHYIYGVPKRDDL